MYYKRWRFLSGLVLINGVLHPDLNGALFGFFFRKAKKAEVEGGKGAQINKNIIQKLLLYKTITIR